MKLFYKILWIDDNIEEFISLGIKDEIQSYLEGLEFITTIDCFETSRLAEDKLQYHKSNYYDLIVSDYDIDNDDKGDVLIKKLRAFEIFTEVLFYSALPNFNQTTIGIDRISYFSLQGDEGYRGFKNKLLTLIDQTVNKLQELPSIRGLVMGETSVLDSAVEEILSEFFKTQTDECEKLKGSILERIENSLKGNFTAENVLKLRNKTNVEIIKSRIFDASKKARTIEELVVLKNLKEEIFNDFFKNYSNDVIETRNKLAHAKSEIIDEVEYLIIDGDEPEKYDSEKCKQIRKNLKKYSEILSELHRIIKGDK
jgi:hypothetical protein